MTTHSDKKAPSPCECKIAGFCERHGFSKNAVLHAVCKNSDERRAEWDRQVAEGTSESGGRAPGLAAKIVKFGGSFTHWVRRGFKRRTEQEVERILTICAMCPTGKFKAGICTDCGCQTAKAKREWYVKMSFLHEHCPDKHW